MADTTFVDQETIIEADWANDVNRLVYTIFQGPQTINDVIEVLPVATEIRKGLLSAADKVKLDNFTIIDVELRGAGFVLELADAFTYFQVFTASNVTVQVPPESSINFPIGTFIYFEQSNIGQIALSPASRINTASTLTTREQNSVIGIVKVAADEWTAFGDLTP